jgi:hypothetical protein
MVPHVDTLEEGAGKELGTSPIKKPPFDCKRSELSIAVGCLGTFEGLAC